MIIVKNSKNQKLKYVVCNYENRVVIGTGINYLIKCVVFQSLFYQGKITNLDDALDVLSAIDIHKGGKS